MRNLNPADNSAIAAYVKKARDGDADAFAVLYGEIYKDLYRIAFLNLNNEADASDAVSDAVVEAFQSLKGLRNPESFKPWFVTILFSKIKKKQREYVRNRHNVTEIDAIDTASETPDELSHGFSFDTAEVKEAFMQLNPQERNILSLSAVSGFKSEEIAKMLSISANTVRSNAARAKEKLRRILS
ncbi:MAG: sigma-70 family RNA polymerase sigma factor [Ruminococcus sp.]|nr:sigma-70 family RNA polymerase sigma factor [Ruminococcus sp.]